MKDTRDLVVIGAGFAGLACAKRAAERGLSVTVVDRQPAPGRHVHTTGIFVREAQEEWPAPPHLVRKLQRVRLYAPSGRHVDLRCDGYYFLATDTRKLMAHLVDEARGAGADIRFDRRFTGATRERDRIVINGHGMAGRFLVGADGVRSRVAQATGLDGNTRLLKGVEWEFEPIEGVGDCLHCFVDPVLAPGYIGWVVPGVGVTQVGLAARHGTRLSIDAFIARLDPIFGLRGRRVLARRGGLIPVNGLLRRFHDERTLLIGDAAGMVSPLTAGGIHSAYRVGRLAGEAIAAYLAGDAPNPGETVKASYRTAPWKHGARWCYDNLPLAGGLELALRTRGLLKRAAGKVFFNRFASTEPRSP